MIKSVIALDPGPVETAYLILTADGIKEFGVAPNLSILPLLRYSQSYEVVCEKVESFGMAVGVSTFETVRWEGEYRCTCRMIGMAFHPVTRKQIKAFWCHTTRATDSNIRQALIDHYGEQGTKKNPGPTYGLKGHTWSTLAIAGYWREQQIRPTL